MTDQEYIKTRLDDTFYLKSIWGSSIKITGFNKETQIVTYRRLSDKETLRDELKYLMQANPDHLSYLDDELMRVVKQTDHEVKELLNELEKK